jgi:CDP-diacylglycerol--serine O-phosphatidyltransferase
MFTAAAALRLARFNTQVASADKRFFQGLPSPAAAAVVATLVWTGDRLELRDSGVVAGIAIVATIAASLLMVSNVRYRSFKDLDLHGRVPFVAVLAVVLGFVLVSLEPATLLLMLFAAYVVSGPVETWVQRRRWRAQRRDGKGAAPPSA